MSDSCNCVDCSLPGSLSMGFSGHSTGVGCHFLFQGIFPTQGSNPSLTSPALPGRFFTASVPPGKLKQAYPVERLLNQTTGLRSSENQDHYFHRECLQGTLVKKVKGWRVYQNHLLLFSFPLSFPSHLPFLVTWCQSLRMD